jgi:hypothetical protein
MFFLSQINKKILTSLNSLGGAAGHFSSDK